MTIVVYVITGWMGRLPCLWF